MTKKNMKPSLAFCTIAALLLAGCGAIQPAREWRCRTARRRAVGRRDGRRPARHLPRGADTAGSTRGRLGHAARLFGNLAVFNSGRATLAR